MTTGNQSFKHICPTCGYSTNRISNFKDHLNRKKPCKPKEDKSIINEDVVSVVQVVSNSQDRLQNVVPNSENVVSNSQAHIKRYACDKCGKTFVNRQNRYRHMKKCKVETTTSHLSSKDLEIQELKSKIRRLEMGGQHIINNNTYNINNSTMNTTNTTNNTTNTVNTITYNNFDKPNVDHITPEMVGDMYLNCLLYTSPSPRD